MNEGGCIGFTGFTPEVPANTGFLLNSELDLLWIQCGSSGVILLEIKVKKARICRTEQLPRL